MSAAETIIDRWRRTPGNRIAASRKGIATVRKSFESFPWLRAPLVVGSWNWVFEERVVELVDDEKMRLDLRSCRERALEGASA